MALGISAAVSSGRGVLAVEQQRMQAERPVDRGGPGIDQQLGGIEPEAAGRVPGAKGAQAVAGAGGTPAMWP